MPKLRNKLLWEGYRSTTLTRWLLWDAMRASAPGREVRSCLSDHRETIVCSSLPDRDRPLVEERRVALTQLSGELLIEPRFGYIIAKPARILPELLTRSDYARRRELMHLFSGAPSLIDYAAVRYGRRNVQRFPAVISLRQPFDGNYYHDMIEVLPKLCVVDAHGVGRDTPVVISPRLFRSSYFQWLLEQTALKERPWVVQDDAYIEAELVYVPEITRDVRRYVDQFVDLIGAPPADTRADRRIFLSRSLSAGRAITNLDAIRPVLQRHNFEVIDSGALPLGEQMTLFSRTRFLAGLHGAGLTNIIFRRGLPLSLLEITSPYYADAGFYHLAQSYGYDHRFLAGEGPLPGHAGANFQVNPAKLEAAIKAMLG